MTPAEQIILFVAQGIADEEGDPNVTRIMKTIYLIDVEFYRRYQRTLTGWDWVLYKYGPYVFDFPKYLDRLGLLGLSETEEKTAGARRYVRVKIPQNEPVKDFGPNTFWIRRIVKTWALEPLEHLLNFVYFETEPMGNPEKGQHLDFTRIPIQVHERPIDFDDLRPSPEMKQRARDELAKLRRSRKEDRDKANELIGDHPLERDEDYRGVMNEVDREMNALLPEGKDVLSAE